MKFSHFVELITVNTPADEFYLEMCHILNYSRFFLFSFNNIYRV